MDAFKLAKALKRFSEAFINYQAKDIKSFLGSIELRLQFASACQALLSRWFTSSRKSSTIRSRNDSAFMGELKKYAAASCLPACAHSSIADSLS